MSTGDLPPWNMIRIYDQRPDISAPSNSAGSAARELDHIAAAPEIVEPVEPIDPAGDDAATPANADRRIVSSAPGQQIAAAFQFVPPVVVQNIASYAAGDEGEGRGGAKGTEEDRRRAGHSVGGARSGVTRRMMT
ncbi:MAG: hypothetical protein WD969_02120 [Paracoccaceae bacterium]